MPSAAARERLGDVEQAVGTAHSANVFMAFINADTTLSGGVS
jgi:hypothetical protein